MKKRRANGEGTLRKRKDGRWESTQMIGWHSDGRRKYKSFYGKTQDEVRKKVQGWRQACCSGIVASKDYLFSEWSEMWFDLHKENIAKSTQEGYRYTLRVLNGYFGPKKLKDIKVYDIEIFLREMKRWGRADSTVAQLKGMMFQIMQKAAANDLIHKNPVAFAEKLRRRMPQKRKDVFSAEQVQILMDELPYNRTGHSIRLLLGTGMRTQELLALEPRHISEDGSKIIVEQAVYLVKGTVRVGVPKSKDSNRVIPVPPSLHFCAKFLRETHRKFIWEEKKEGCPCNPTFFRDQFRAALEAIPEMPLLTPHCCRHTYVSQMQALGVDVSTIQSIVGHAEIDMTEYYLHVQDAVKIEAASKFAKAFQIKK